MTPEADGIVRRPSLFDLPTGQRCLVMGVLNVTPDSFSDGGNWLDPDKAITHGLELTSQGADIVDVGGESTRPGAQPVGAAEEIRRVAEVVKGLAGRVTVSIDTYKAEVADVALGLGAEIVNDISGGALDPELLAVVARRGAAVVLGHLRGSPLDMQSQARYTDVVSEVRDQLRERLDRARAAGIPPERTLIDPGLGFAKTADHNLALLARLDALAALGRPIVIGASRKSFLGPLTGQEAPEARDAPSVAAHVAAILHGANVVRVHNVAAHRDPIRVADAIRRAGDG
jgi:dihydropteroate synthase